MRVTIENDRHTFLTAMAQIKQGLSAVASAEADAQGGEAPAQGGGARAGGAGGGRGGGGRGGRGGGVIPPLLMKTDAFEDGGLIPERYAGRGGNVRPGFTFSNVPNGTVSFAIILQNLDVAANGAEGVLHWGWHGTSPPKQAGSRRALSRKVRSSELRESAAETTLDLALPPALATITTSSGSTR
jgi:hypothetical protein